ncbi:MAG: peptidase M16 [Micavibrio sp.]|nr:MAG: peptidase M16 [Micavibrio sp.]
MLIPLQAYAQTDIKADSPVQGEKVFNAETFKLDNGLEIIVIPNHRTPVVTHMVWYKVGGADETQGKSGIAHFMEHLMFKGSTGLASGEFSKTVRKLGGNDNAFTGQDYTAYFQSIAVEHLEKIMTMEAGRMRGMNPPLQEVESERKVILEERRQRTDNDPRGRFGEQMNAALYVNHPYGTPVIGWFHEMEKLTWDDAKTFYDKWYGPNNAILIVSGDVTGAEVHELAKKIYGPLKRVETIPERNRTISPPLHAQTKVLQRHPAIAQAIIQRNYRVPSYRQNKKDSLALQVIEEIMGGGATSRLYKSLVIEQKLATSASMSYRADSWDDTTLTVYAAPAPGKHPEEVERALEQELRKLVSAGITEDELQDAKTRMQDAAIYARDSLSGPAMAFGHALATGSTVDDVEYWPQRIEEITAEQAQNVAQRFLDPDGKYDHPPVTGYLLPPAPKEVPQENIQKIEPAANDNAADVPPANSEESTP